MFTPLGDVSPLWRYGPDFHMRFLLWSLSYKKLRKAWLFLISKISDGGDKRKDDKNNDIKKHDFASLH